MLKMERIPRSLQKSVHVETYPIKNSKDEVTVSNSINIKCQNWITTMHKSNLCIHLKKQCTGRFKFLDMYNKELIDLLSLPLINRNNSFEKPTYECKLLQSVKLKTSSWTIFPKVYAKSVEDLQTDTNNENQKSTMERLLESKPQGSKIGLVTDEEVSKYIENESGMDRVKMLFSKRYDNTYHRDLTETVSDIKACVIGIFIAASFLGGRRSRLKFIEKNKATKWQSNYLAAKAALDASIMGGMREGMRWSFRFLYFMTTFMVVAKSVEAYRNKSGMMEYVTACGITCALSRFNHGLSGIAAAGIIGIGFGLIGGWANVAMMNATGNTQDRKHFLYVREMLEKQREIDTLSPSS